MIIKQNKIHIQANIEPNIDNITISDVIYVFMFDDTMINNFLSV